MIGSGTHSRISAIIPLHPDSNIIYGGSATEPPLFLYIGGGFWEMQSHDHFTAPRSAHNHPRMKFANFVRFYYGILHFWHLGILPFLYDSFYRLLQFWHLQCNHIIPFAVSPALNHGITYCYQTVPNCCPFDNTPILIPNCKNLTQLLPFLCWQFPVHILLRHLNGLIVQ